MIDQSQSQVQNLADSVLLDYWYKFRKNIIGIDMTFENKHGCHKVLYADWIASGRLYGPIEHALSQIIGTVVSNPHSYSSYTGTKINSTYQEARHIIRNHVNANKNDILVTVGSGMTDAVMRLQEILGLKEKRHNQKPVIFITHMEHHSNHVVWMELSVDVVIVPPNDHNLVDPNNLRIELKKYNDRKLKIGAFSACSNVTGVINPIHELASVMHDFGGYCFADYAASAPYVNINMHPEQPDQDLDAIYFSPHKFLGGPGSCGVLIFNKMFHNGIPSIPGGGNVKWTDPRGNYEYSKDIETLEDGGTPAFLQTIKASMAIILKEKMNVDHISRRENELLKVANNKLNAMENIHVLKVNDQVERVGCIAFNVEGLHYNLVVKLLNNRFGIQVRGGWSCASTYAHYLFEISMKESIELTQKIDQLDASSKPGWVRLSLHPTMTDEELDYCIEAIKQVVENGETWINEFIYNSGTNEFDQVLESDSKEVRFEKILYDFDD